MTDNVLRWMMVLVLSTFALSPAWAADDEEEPIDGEEGEEQPTKPKEPPKPHVNVDPDKTRLNFLARQSNPREIIQLQALDEEVLSLFLPENQSEALGAVILLHEEDAHPDWAGIINPVRRNLPDYGWATLAVALPSPGAPIQPERTMAAVEVLTEMPDEGGEEGEEASEEGAIEEGEEGAEGEGVEEETGAADTDEEGDELGGEDEAEATPPPEPEKPKAPIDQRVKARIDAALAQLEEMNYERIVLFGHGTGAAWVLGYLKQNPLAPEIPIVLVQPRLPLYDIGLDLSGLLGEQQRPVLDLYYTDTPYDKQRAKDRANFARRAGNLEYRQSRLSGNSVSSQTEARGRRIVQSIRGWLNSRVARDSKRQPEDPYLKNTKKDPYLPNGVRYNSTLEEKKANGEERSERTSM